MSAADLSLAEAADQLMAGTLRSESLTEACLERAKATAPLNAYLHLAEEGARAAAKALLNG